MRLHYRMLPVAVAALVLVEGLALAADPTTADCLAASDASLKLGNQHKLRAERAQLLVCAASSCPKDIVAECIHRVDEVNAQIPTIIFAAKDSTGADLSAVKVTMDGEVLAERLEGAALSIDPGEHTFTFETAGQPVATRKLVIQEAQKDRREAIVFRTPTATPVAAPAPRTASGSPPPGPAAAEEGQGMGTQKVLALVAGGIGVVGLGIGTAFGISAMSQKNDAQNACPGNPCSTQDGVNKWSTAGSTGNVATIGFIVAGVGAVGGAVLWFTAPGSASTQVGLGPGVLQVKAVW